MSNSKSTKGKKSLPKFKTESAEDSFWQKHDSTEYIDWSEGSEAIFPLLKPTTKNISLRLPLSMIEHLKLLGMRQDVPYQTLLKMYLSERVDEELRKLK